MNITRHVACSLVVSSLFNLRVGGRPIRNTSQPSACGHAYGAPLGNQNKKRLRVCGAAYAKSTCAAWHNYKTQSVWPAWSQAACDPGIMIPFTKVGLVYGLACSIHFLLPASYYLTTKFEGRDDHFEQAVLSAINSGGNNMARAALTGRPALMEEK